MRHTRSQTKQRRSHHALDASAWTLCKDCGSPVQPHVVCSVCGKYKGRAVLDLHLKLVKKEKKNKEKTKESR